MKAVAKRTKVAPSLKPLGLPAQVRAFAYDEIVLAWECRAVSINPSKFDAKLLLDRFGVEVRMVKGLSELQEQAKRPRSGRQLLVFYKDRAGYETLFKRLRDAFAHGHVGQPKAGWIELHHHYKGPRDSSEKTRLFGVLEQSKLKDIVRFIGSKPCKGIERASV